MKNDLHNFISCKIHVTDTDDLNKQLLVQCIISLFCTNRWLIVDYVQSNFILPISDTYPTKTIMRYQYDPFVIFIAYESAGSVAMVVFLNPVNLYCCAGCSSCLANAIQMRQATSAVWAAIIRYSLTYFAISL